MSGWGTLPWGSGPWGLDTYANLFILGAVATGERTLEVSLSRPPLQSSAIADGDAENPETWTVTRLDTGENLIVIGARRASSDTVFELFTLTPFEPYLISHRVAAPGLRDTAGNPIVLPYTFDWAGCEAFVPAVVPSGLVDLASPQASPTQAGGTLVVDASGDYATESGDVLLQKLVIRRLTTDPNGFFHLDDYGTGLKVKEPVRESQLPAFQAFVTRQVSLEPEFDRVKVRVTFDNGTGILTLFIIARVRATQQDVPVTVPVAGV